LVYKAICRIKKIPLPNIVKLKKMKNTLKYSILIILSIAFFNCGGNDDDAGKDEIIGEWRIIYGSIYNGADKFAYFNTDNSLDVLRQTSDNFKGNFNTTYSITGSEITISGISVLLSSSTTYTYVLEDDILTLSNDFTTDVTLQKVSYSTPTVEDWVKPLEIIEEGNAPAEGVFDMAFNYDKSLILYGKGEGSEFIALIDPSTMEEVWQIPTTHYVNAVEVEKADFPDRFVFQSDSRSTEFYGYYEDTNTLALISEELESYITGLASVNQNKIWVASADESTLYLYDYFTDSLEESIPLFIVPIGLDYQDNTLYVCDGTNLHKCQVAPEFEVLESYSVPNIAIYGVAFDGTNFWLNGKNSIDDTYKIIKTNLTL
jgi:hypothetical protein